MAALAHWRMQMRPASQPTPVARTGLGTWRYQAPEARTARGAAYPLGKVDIFPAGIILAMMLLGWNPLVASCCGGQRQWDDEENGMREVRGWGHA